MALPRSTLLLAAALTVALSGCASDTGAGNQAAPDIAAQALQAGAADGPARAFYEARQWRAAWTPERAEALVATLRGAAAHGLEPQTFLAAIDAARDPAAREIALTQAALGYADALARGRVDPASLTEVYTVPRPQVDVAAGLATAVEGNDLRGWIEGLAPQDAEYRALSAAYAEARTAATQAGAAGSEPQRLAAARAMVLAVNLERRRWLERSPPEQRIDVNTAAAFLVYYRGGQPVDRRVVVAGEPGWETPELGSPMFRLVANPDWTVPSSIENSELSGLSAAAMARRNMRRENGRLVQQPGPTNALGQVKFDMRNDHAIYLHDTPSRAAFDQAERHLSHGCVRVRDALGFARMIADDMGVRAQFDQAMAGRDTTMVDLPREIPVRLLYQTVRLEEGRLVSSPDVYGWDRRLARALGVAASEGAGEVQAEPAPRRRSGSGDIGP